MIETLSVPTPRARLAVDVAGPDDGLPILLLHGFPLTRSMWAPQVGALSDHYRLIVPDARGLGESRDQGFPRTFERYVDDALVVLDAVEVDEVVVVGLSMGGYVALRLRERASARVRALVLSDTRSGPDDDEGRLGRAAAVARLLDGDREGFARDFPDGVLGRSRRTPELEQLVVSMILENSAEGMAAALVAMATRTDTTPRLGDIAVPTLVVVGEEDTLTPPDQAESMTSAIPGGRLERIEGAGHLSNLEAPEAFTRVLDDFLRSLER